MTTAEIIKQICSETGMDFTCKESLELVPFNDLNVHKTQVWNLTITNTPDDYFSLMSQQYPNKIGYRFKLGIANASQGLVLCRALSQELGLPEVQIPFFDGMHAQTGLYLAIHIHPEFLFTPNKTRSAAPTQELKLCFV